jgi:hypothetical protein
LPALDIPVSVNSVELGETTIPANGEIRLDLPHHVIRKLDLGHAFIRPIVIPCYPHTECGSGVYTIKKIQIVDA